MLTNAAVARARSKDRAYKLSDERGLHLYVAPSGLRSWRWRFRIDGREQLLTIGSYPDLALDDARARRDEHQDQLARGEDPRVCAISQTQVRTFELVARAWHGHMLPRWTSVHAYDAMASLERDIFPAIGAMPLAAITAPVVLSALRAVEQRAPETARRVRQRISAVFVFAMGEGWCQGDPAAIVGKALMPPAPARQQPALLQIEDVRELLAAVDQLDAAPSFKLASRFLALTAVRLAGVRGARWCEIEDLDGPAPVWRIPAARMKLTVAKKGDAKHDHIVPLAPAAVEVLRAARALQQVTDSGNPVAELIFPGRSGLAPIGGAAIGELYARAGFAGRHVPHGWRASFSTIMNESGAFDRRLIDQALAHAPKDKVEAAYNRAQMLDQRRQLFEAWAAALVG